MSKQALLAAALISDIKLGRYPIGAMLPTEEAMCAKYGVSRYTVRSALRVLRNKGFVESKRPTGTRVIADKESERQTIRLTSLRDLVELSQGGKQVVIHNSNVSSDEELAREIGCPVDQHWQHVKVKRWTGNKSTAPTMLSELWIHPMYAAIAEDLPLNESAPLIVFIEAVGEQFGVSPSSIKQAVSAVSLTKKFADILQLEEGSAGLITQRWFFDARGEIILYAKVTYNAKLYTVYSTIELEGEGRS